MSLNLNAMYFSGTVLFWLGIVLGVIAIVLFAASGGAIPYSSTTTTSNEIGLVNKTVACGVTHLGWMARLVYLLPLLAGIILIMAGLRIRKSILEMKDKDRNSDLRLSSKTKANKVS